MLEPSLIVHPFILCGNDGADNAVPSCARKIISQKIGIAQDFAVMPIEVERQIICTPSDFFETQKAQFMQTFTHLRSWNFMFVLVALADVEYICVA
jgi:hypothetical protein